MIRILIFLYVLLAICLPLKAVNAYPNKVKVAIETGDTVEITLKGDEFQKYAISEDGYILVPKDNKWFYLSRDSISNYSVANIELKKRISKNLSRSLVKADAKISITSSRNNISRVKRQTINGSISHALVILIEYPDKRFVKTQQEIYDLFNKIGYDDDRAHGSVRDFYNYASYGKFDLISDIYGPYTTKSSMEFYGGNQSNGNDTNTLELAVEAIQNLPDDIDLSIYDNNNDGAVDNIHIIFAGYGEESGAPSSTIWSHEYPYPLPITKNGFKIAGYSCTPELRSNMGNGISRIGVICHELGHAFGANDYYDVDYASNGSYEGTGVWDLMASGSWNDNGISPANFNPYVKIMDFGWITPIMAEESRCISLSPYNFIPEVLRIPTSNPDEYYLVEYRKATSFDKGLPGEGLLIYHTHSLIESRRGTNTINNRHPQYFYPVCASSEESPFETSIYGDINSAGCPYPGSTKNTEFSSSSIPYAFQWNGNPLNFAMTNIRVSNDEAEFDLYFDSLPPSENQPTGTFIYKETFENGLSHFINDSLEGNTTWSIYPTNSLSTMNDLPQPIEGRRALMLCDGNKSVIKSKAILTSEKINLNPDSIYVMSYHMRTKEAHLNGSNNLIINFRNPNSNSWINVYETSESISEWTEIQVELPHDLSYLFFQFVGEVLNSGIFIDDVKINSIGLANISKLNVEDSSIFISTNPLLITANTCSKIDIYDITGKMIDTSIITPTSTIMPQLKKGIYVICTDKGERYKIMI